MHFCRRQRFFDSKLGLCPICPQVPKDRIVDDQLLTFAAECIEFAKARIADLDDLLLTPRYELVATWLAIELNVCHLGGQRQNELLPPTRIALLLYGDQMIK